MTAAEPQPRFIFRPIERVAEFTLSLIERFEMTDQFVCCHSER
jgi:hypothetical protein